MAKVSVVVPIYNVEQYLEECLDSIVNQTLEDIEIILVNDGSTDRSPQICDEYAQKDSRIKVIHKENAGLGVAYNAGIDAATGEYIGFIESDDFTVECMYEDLYNLAKKHDADMVKSEWFNYNTSTNFAEKDFQITWVNSWSVTNVFEYPALLKVQASVWSAIYKREWLNANNIRYLETPGASYQDVAFSFKVLAKAERLVLSPSAYLHYRQDNANASIKSTGKVRAIFQEYEEVDRFFDENPHLKDALWVDKLRKQHSDFFWNLNRVAAEYKNEFVLEFASIFKNYEANGDLPEEFLRFIDVNRLQFLMNNPKLYCKLNY